MSQVGRELQVQVDSQRGGFHLKLDLKVRAGGVTAIFGKSGAGKSSLLRVIAGLDRLKDARVQFDSMVWQDEEKGLWVPPHKRRIGYVFQGPSLFEHLSVAQNLGYARKRAEADGAGCDVLARLGLEELYCRKVVDLSGGEKQRVAIARALISNPQILLMDEPVSALDSVSKEEVLSAVREVQRNSDIPIFYVSHSLDEVARLADQLLLMGEGMLKQQGPISDMLVHPRIAVESNTALETVIDALVVGFDPKYGLCRLEFDRGELWVANQGFQMGQKVRARIMARDLSLALKRPEQTSIQNVVAASVVGMRASSGAQTVVELGAGNCRLLAQVTRRSVDRLGLAPGKEVYAQIKSVALLS